MQYLICYKYDESTLIRDFEGKQRKWKASSLLVGIALRLAIKMDDPSG